MGIEPFNAMNDSMYLSLMLMMIKVIALIIALFVIAGFAIYLAGIAWLCCEETLRPTCLCLSVAPGEIERKTVIPYADQSGWHRRHGLDRVA